MGDSGEAVPDSRLDVLASLGVAQVADPGFHHFVSIDSRLRGRSGDKVVASDDGIRETVPDGTTQEKSVRQRRNRRRGRSLCESGCRKLWYAK